MGYDDDVERSGRRRSRARQPVKRPGAREPEYRKNREPEKQREQRRQEPELNLITDSFREDGYHKNRGRKETAAAAQGDAGFYRTPAKKKAQKRRRKIFIILLEAVILISVLVFAAYSYLDNRMGEIQRLPWDPDSIKNVEISEEKQEQMKGYWTIAIYGVDSRNSSVGKGNNSDVNIICNINQDTGEIKLVSVFRDTYLNIKDNNTYNKINAAYLNGGPEQAVWALNRNLDLDVDDYAVFNWKAVADAINILGGIDLELSKAEFYYINAFVTETVKATGVPSEPVKHAGAVHLDGVQAVAYGRLRLMDTDYARTERQRKVISLAFDKAKKADWATLNNVIQTVFANVTTSVDLNDILGMGRNVGKLHLGETMGFPASRGEANMGKKGACVIPQTLESNVKDLHKFLFGDEDYTPTEAVKSISKKIISDTGLAKTAKPVDHVDTNGGSVPKAKKETDSDKESKAKESSENLKGESESGVKESESGSEKGSKPDSTWEQWETDADGNWVEPTVKESSGSMKPGTDTTKPGTEKPGTTKPDTGNVKPGVPSTTEAETAPPRPGSNTDTGVILGPGEGAPGSGNNSNAPGSETTSNAPGSGGNTSQAPGSGNSGVEFEGPSGQ